jgi:hypothetical protein
MNTNGEILSHVSSNRQVGNETCGMLFRFKIYQTILMTPHNDARLAFNFFFINIEFDTILN